MPATKYIAGGSVYRVVELLKINDLRTGMKNVSIEAKILDMNAHMLYVSDESGKTFVRYWGVTEGPIKTGDYVKIENGDVVNYSGILQMKMGRKGKIKPV